MHRLLNNLVPVSRVYYQHNTVTTRRILYLPRIVWNDALRVLYLGWKSHKTKSHVYSTRSVCVCVCRCRSQKDCSIKIWKVPTSPLAFASRFHHSSSSPPSSACRLYALPPPPCLAFTLPPIYFFSFVSFTPFVSPSSPPFIVIARSFSTVALTSISRSRQGMTVRRRMHVIKAPERRRCNEYTSCGGGT